MLPPPIPANEAERVAALQSYAILDTLPEQAWNDIAVLAARLCHAPIAIVTFVDAKRQWFKARIGLPIDETPREWSFCAHAIAQPEQVMVVEDASKDARFVGNPFVTMDSGLRFYAGAPIVTPEGHALGTVCVFSPEVRGIGQAELDGLEALGRQVSSALAFRRFSMLEVDRARQQADEVLRAHTALYEEKERARVTLGAIGDGVITTDAAGLIDYLNPIAEAMIGLSREQATGLPIEEVMTLLDETTHEPVDNPLRTALKEDRTVESVGQACLIGKGGVKRGVEENASPIRDTAGHIIGGVMVFRDVTQTRLLSRRLSHMALHDALTGLPNRVQFTRAASELLASTKADQREHALLCLDLDGFKAVNDSCGHPAGDELLRELSKALSSKLRKSDLLARMGGDEFAVLLPDCPVPVAQQIAQSLVSVVRDHRFTWQDQVLRVGLSVGVTALRADTKGFTEAICEADSACYEAKRTGRNRARLYEPCGIGQQP